jgi:hypothetical protein
MKFCSRAKSNEKKSKETEYVIDEEKFTHTYGREVIHKCLVALVF